MKIVKYFILVTAIVLSSSCEKKSSKEDFNQISDRTESRTLQLVNDVNKNNEKLKTIENIPQPDNNNETDYNKNFKIVIESLNKKFRYGFPEIISSEKVRIENYDISSLSTEEQDFYHKYVGSFFVKQCLTYDYLERNIYEIKLRRIENGIKFYSLGKLQDGVNFSTNDKMFYEYESFSTIPIENITTYSMHEEFEKITSESESDDVFEDAIKRKISVFEKLSKNKIDEQQVRNLLLSFFKKLSNENFTAIVDTCIDSKNIKSINYDKTVEIIPEEVFLSKLSWWNTIFSNAPAFDVYANVYFSEDPVFISENFGDCIFIEFNFNDHCNYFSFVIKEIDSQLKIVGCRYAMDEE